MIFIRSAKASVLATLVSSAALAISALNGCAHTETTLPPPEQPATQPQTASEIVTRVTDLQGKAVEYAAGATKLPGRNEIEDRAMVGQQFATLGQIIPLVAGAELPGDLTQQLRIIESTRGQLLNGSAELSIEPTVDSGLRAAHRALVSVNQRSFIEVPEVAKALDAMKLKVNELDSATGPLHRLVVSQALQASAQAVTAMAGSMETRLIDKNATPASPATPPVPAPATPAVPAPATPAVTPATPAVPETLKPEAPKVEAPKVEAPKVEAPKVEAPRVETPATPATPAVPAPPATPAPTTDLNK